VEGRTVLQHSPLSLEADVFSSLAGRILDNHMRVIPTPIEEVTDLEALYRRHLGLRATRQAVQEAAT
jgi:nitrogenase iron protein NifH